jgi:hypothetical protein
MPELKRKVIPIWVEYACDECIQKPNPGCLLKPSAFGTYQSHFFYECPNCKKLYEFKNAYPRIEYEESNE